MAEPAEQTLFLPRRATTRMFTLVGIGDVVVFTPLLVWGLLTPDPAQVVGVPVFAAFVLLGAGLWARGVATQRNCRLELTPRGFTYVSPWGRPHRVAAASVRRLRVVVARTQGFVAVGAPGADVIANALIGAAEGVAQARGHVRPVAQVLEVVAWGDAGRVALPMESLDPRLADVLVPALVARGLPRDRIEVRLSRKRVMRA